MKKTSRSLPTRLGFATGFLCCTCVSVLQAQPGSIDTRFNAATVSGEVGYSLAMQADGKLLAVGTFGLKRFLSSGAEDPSFAPEPRGMVAWTGVGIGTRAVAVQPDGRILLTGNFINEEGAPLPSLMRLHPDGSMDSSFNLDANAYPNGFIVALQPDGKVLTGGYVSSPDGTEHSGLMRLLEDGSIDPAFDLHSYGGSTDFSALALGRDGSIYLGLFSVVARFHPDGTFDDTFNPEPGQGRIGVIMVQTDGRILLGQYGDGPGHRSLRRLLSHGADDPEWMPPTIEGGDHVIFAIQLQPDGKMLIGGNNLQRISGVPVASLGRLKANGGYDASFDTRGDLYYYSVEHLALAPDGGVYVAGFHSSWPNVQPAPGVWRLNNDSGLQPRLGIRVTPQDGMTLRLTGFPGSRYRLDYRAGSPSAGVWTPLTTLTLTTSTEDWDDADWAGSTTRFYRAVWVP